MARNPGMPHGGKRSGSGRKPGGRNKITQTRIAEAEAGGEMPLPMMLRYMRGAEAEHYARDAEGNLALDGDKKPAKYTAPLALNDQLKLAIAAAPYLHARLNNINHEGGIDLTSIPDALLAQLRDIHRALAAGAAGQAGSGARPPGKAAKKR